MKQAAAAGFITRKGGFFQEHDIEAVAGEGEGGGTAGGAGADYGDVMTFHSLKIADWGARFFRATEDPTYRME